MSQTGEAECLMLVGVVPVPRVLGIQQKSPLSDIFLAFSPFKIPNRQSGEIEPDKNLRILFAPRYLEIPLFRLTVV